jgi:hypothetical protein
MEWYLWAIILALIAMILAFTFLIVVTAIDTITDLVDRWFGER